VQTGLTPSSIRRSPPRDDLAELGRHEFRRADWILLACTRAYRLFYEGGGIVWAAGCWEANLIRQELSDNKFVNPRFVPILPTGGGEGDIPPALRGLCASNPMKNMRSCWHSCGGHPWLTKPTRAIHRSPE
jgi:hypothetical protein